MVQASNIWKANFVHCLEFWEGNLRGGAANDWQPWTETVSGATWSVQSLDTGMLRCALSANQTDSGQAAGEVQYRGDRNGLLTARARIRTSVANKSSIFFGLTDSNAETGGLVLENEDGTLNTVPANCAGLLLEGEQDEHWLGISVKGSADSDLIEIVGAPTVGNNQFFAVGLSVNSDGDVIYYVNGMHSPIQKAAVNPATQLCWSLSADARGTAYNVEMEIVEVCGTVWARRVDVPPLSGI